MKKSIRLHNIEWTISAVMFVALLALTSIEGILKTFLFMLAAGIACLFCPDMGVYFRAKNRKADVLALLICVLAGVNVYDVWNPSDKIVEMIQRLGLSESMFLTMVAACGSVGGYYAVRSVVGAWPAASKVIREHVPQSVLGTHDAYQLNKKEYLFLLIVSAAAITICSKSSPIYPFNDWVDANSYFTAGKSMLYGKVLYRDSYEHKGVLLYAMHALAYLISNTTFLGIYLLEIAAAFAFLVLAYKTALLLCADRKVLYVMPGFAAVVYGAQAFCHGDSAEEFCLPLVAYAIWVGIKAVRREELPNKKEFFWIGVTSGCVLWIKYTILGFYLGWYMLFFCAMAKARDWKGIFDSLKMIGLGVAAVTIPVLLYYGLNGALGDLGKVYFYNNMFVYRDETQVPRKLGVLGNIITGARNAMMHNMWQSILLLCALLWYSLDENKRVLKLLICSMIGMAMFVFIGNMSYIYYALIFCVFLVAALPMLNCLRIWSGIHIRTLTAGGAILMVLLSNNTYMLRYSKEELPQYAFKEIIEQVENPSLLNYGFLDGGFYTVCNIVPMNKYFHTVNMTIEESEREQNDYVEQGITDFVVTRNLEIQAERYECVSEKDFEFENKMRKYRLYALKELNLK